MAAIISFGHGLIINKVLPDILIIDALMKT